jgi:hypothetical protein
MPVSSFGYVLGHLIESVVIVVKALINARSSQTMFENPVSITSPDTSFDTDKRNLL